MSKRAVNLNGSPDSRLAVAALHFVNMPPERFDWSDRRPPQASPSPAGLAPAGLAEVEGAAPVSGGAAPACSARPRGTDQALGSPGDGRDHIPHRPGSQVRHRHDRLARVLAARGAARRRRRLDRRGPRQHQRDVPRAAAARPDRDPRGVRGPAGQPGRRPGPALRAAGGRGPAARRAPGRSPRHRPVDACRVGPVRPAGPGTRAAPRFRVLVAAGRGARASIAARWRRGPAGRARPARARRTA